MNHGRRRLRFLASSIFTLVAFANMTAVAQAAPGWVFEGSTHEELGIESETIKGTGGSLTLTVSKLGVTVKCSAQSVTGSVSQGGKGSATLKLTECLVSPGEKTCTVTPITAKVKAELVEVKGSIYIVIAAESGTTLMTIEYTGEECPLPGSVKVTGSAAASVGAEKKPLALSFSGAAASATGAHLLYGTSSATLSGTVNVEPSGAHTGKAMGAVSMSTALCTEPEFANGCSGPNTFAANNEFEGVAPMAGPVLFTLGAASFTCSTGRLVGKNLAERAQPLPMLPQEMTIGGCNNECGLFKLEVANTSVLRATTLGNGRWTLQRPAIGTQCPGQQCLYEKPTAVLKFEGGEPANIRAEAVPLSLKETFEGTCPDPLLWTAVYKINVFKKTYVTG